MAYGFDAQALSVLVKEAYEPTFWKAFERNNDWIKRLSSVRASLTAKDIRWKVQIAGNPLAGSYREDGSMGINNPNSGAIYTHAQLHWRQNRIPIIVTGLAQAISRSPDSIIDAMAEQTRDSLEELMRNMSLQLLSDGEGNLNGVHPRLDPTGSDMTGILACWDDGSDVPFYAGINRALNPFWQSFVLRNPAGIPRPISEEIMHQVFNEMRGVRGANITDITCSLNLLTQCALLLGQDRRYNTQANAGETPGYSGGFDRIKFNGVEISGVPLYQAGRMDFWDNNLLRLYVLLDFVVEPRDPGDRDALVMVARTYSQIAYRNCFHSASIRDLLETGTPTP